jgi:hypothetical protein
MKSKGPVFTFILLPLSLFAIAVALNADQRRATELRQQSEKRQRVVAAPIQTESPHATSVPVHADSGLWVPPGKWREHVLDNSKMDDSKSAMLSLAAENPITVRSNNTTMPSLVIECVEHGLEVYIETESSAQPELGKYDEYSARIRFDKERAEKILVHESTDSKALFLSTRGDLIMRLQIAHKFIFEFTPFNSNRTAIEFDVRGLSLHIPVVKDACSYDAPMASVPVAEVPVAPGQPVHDESVTVGHLAPAFPSAESTTVKADSQRKM